MGRRSKGCDTGGITRERFTLINGGAAEAEARRDAEFAFLLEEVDARDALPQLRRLARQMRPAANGVLEEVQPAQQAAGPEGPAA